MGARLWQLLEDYELEFGGTPAWVARKAGMRPASIYKWRDSRGLPDVENLERVAKVIRQDYRTVVLAAALIDAGRLPDDSVDPPTPPATEATA